VLRYRCGASAVVGWEGNGVMNWARDRAVGWVLAASVFVSVRWCHDFAIAIAIVRLWRGVVGEGLLFLSSVV
jgi:hypothetical protein